MLFSLFTVTISATDFPGPSEAYKCELIILLQKDCSHLYSLFFFSTLSGGLFFYTSTLTVYLSFSNGLYYLLNDHAFD